MSTREEKAKSLIKPTFEAYKVGQFEKCIEISNQGIELDPFVITSYYFKALSLVGLDKYEDALQVCKDAVEYMEDFDKEKDFKDLNNVQEMSFARGEVYFHLKDYQEAIKWFERTQNLQSGSGNLFMETWLACNNLGKCHSVLGNDKEALEWFEKANKLSHGLDYEDANLNMSITYHKMGQLDKALEKLKKVSKLYSPLYWNTKGLLLLAQKKEKFAARAFDKAEEYLAKGEHDQGQTRNERSELEKAVREKRDQLILVHPRPSELKLANLKPMEGFSREEQAESLISPAAGEYRKGEYEKCIEFCDQAIAIEPFVINPYYWKAYSLIGLDRPEDAIKVCDEAIGFIEDFETDNDAYGEKCIRNICFAKGNAFFQLKNYTEAMKLYNRAVSMRLAIGKSWNDACIACNNLGEVSLCAWRIHRSFGMVQESKKRGWWSQL